MHPKDALSCICQLENLSDPNRPFTRHNMDCGKIASVAAPIKQTRVVKRLRVESLPQFLTAVLEISHADLMLFRGHTDRRWTLTPTLGRAPLRGGTREVVERNLVRGFQAECLPHLQNELKDEWDVLAMAQHHGLMTRLLDWSENPLAALWFAVRVPAFPNFLGTVWVFVPEDDDLADKQDGSPFQATQARTLFFRPSHLTPRIVAQRGWFSVHRYAAATDRFSTLERIPRYRNRLHRIDIPSGAFSDLRWELDRVGINQATMFPGLDGLSGQLNWLHTQLADEGSP